MPIVPCIFEKDINGIAIDQIAVGQEWTNAGNVMTTRKPDGVVCYIKLGKLFKEDDSPAQWFNGADVAYADAAELLKKERTRFPDRFYILANASFASGQGAVKTSTLYPYVALANQTPDLSIHSGWTEIPFLTKQFSLKFNLLRAVCETRGISGIVMHHPDGRYAEVTRADFGLPLVLPGEVPTPEQISFV